MLFYVYKYTWQSRFGENVYHIYAASQNDADKIFKKRFGKGLLSVAKVTRTNW